MKIIQSNSLYQSHLYMFITSERSMRSFFLNVYGRNYWRFRHEPISWLCESYISATKRVIILRHKQNDEHFSIFQLIKFSKQSTKHSECRSQYCVVRYLSFRVTLISVSGAARCPTIRLKRLASLFCYVTTSVIGKHNKRDHVRKMF